MIKTLNDALARETELAETLSNTTQGIVVVMDLEGRIAFGNQFLADLGGYESTSALIGLDWFDCFLPEKDRELIRDLYGRALGGHPIVANRNPVVDHEGNLHEMEWSARLMHDDEGKVLGLLSVGIDVTPVAHAQRAFEREQARLASVIAGTQDAFIFIDGSAHILAFNAAAERTFGYSADEVLGKNVSMLMPEPYRGQHGDYIQRYERTGEAKAIGRIRVVHGQRKDGEVFPIELSITKVGTDGEARYAAFIRDISETVRLREKAEERQRLAAIGTTSAKFAHEVGNPLNGMLMNLQLIQRRITKGVPSADLAPLVGRVDQEVRRLTTLLNEFRSMSRRQAFRFRLIPPQSLLEDFVADRRREYEVRGVRVEAEWSSSLPSVHVDREKMTQVLLNLAKNAVEAMGDGGGVLGVHAHEDDGHVVVELRDTGSGIPEGVDVFEPFITTKADGTGLGLPVARQIVAAHGGELSYRSEPGQGTIFVVRLPIDPPASVSAVGLPIVRP